MESVIFKDSPLAEYLLEGTGENDISVEPASFIEPIEPTHSFAPAPPSFSSRLAARGAKSLRLSGSGWNWRHYVFDLLSQIADSRLSNSENARFLEQFRYGLVASQLLNEHNNVSHYNRRGSDLHLIATKNESNNSPGLKFAKIRHWAGDGACVGVMVVLLGWVLRWGEGGTKALLSLLGIITVAVFLFAHARRRWLRGLRDNAIAFAGHFVEQSQRYDILVSNAVTFIQEVELVSRGYRISMPLPPITRMERDSQRKRCARLRRAVLSSLKLAIGPHNLAFLALRKLIDENDLEKYFDVYEVTLEDLADAELGVRDDEFDDMEGLKALKTLFHRMHTARRVFLCCLLALDANGGHSDLSVWRTAVEELRSLRDVIGELGTALHRASEEEERINVPISPVSKSSQSSPTTERWRGQLRKLNSLSQSLRGLQAKMQVLREESDRRLHGETDISEVGPDLLAHYDSIGADLQALVSEWESGRAMLLMNIDRQGSESNRNSIASVMSSSTADALAGDTPRNSWGVLPPRSEEEIARLKADCTTPPQEEEEEEEVIFEGVAEPKGLRPRSKLTREERIKLVQEERVRVLEQRRAAETSLSLVKELQTVLVNRPQPHQRRVAARTGSP